MAQFKTSVLDTAEIILGTMSSERRSLHCLKIQNKVWKICFPCNQQFSQNWRYCKKGIDFHFVADFGIAEEGPNSFVGGRYKTFGVDLLAWRSRIFGGLLFPVLADECGWLFVPCRCKSHSQEYLEWSLAGHFSRTRIQLVLDQFGWAQGCLVAPENFRGAVTVKSAVFLEGSGVVRDLLDDVRVLQFLVNESTTTKSSNANTIAWLSSAHPGAVIDETFCPKVLLRWVPCGKPVPKLKLGWREASTGQKKICRPSSYIKTHELLSCVHVSE